MTTTTLVLTESALAWLVRTPDADERLAARFHPGAPEPCFEALVSAVTMTWAAWHEGIELEKMLAAANRFRERGKLDVRSVAFDAAGARRAGLVRRERPELSINDAAVLALWRQCGGILFTADPAPWWADIQTSAPGQVEVVPPRPPL